MGRSAHSSAETVPGTHAARVPHEERRELLRFYGQVPGLSFSGEPSSPVSWSMLSPAPPLLQLFTPGVALSSVYIQVQRRACVVGVPVYPILPPCLYSL